MSDAEMSDAPPDGLFFAGSDDEDSGIAEAGPLSSSRPQTPDASDGVSSEPVSEGLFLQGSDDEAADSFMDSVLSPVKKLPMSPLPPENNPTATESSSPSAKSPKRLQSFPIEPHKSITPPAPKKRRISPSDAESKPPPNASHYIGDFVIPNAWSNVSGKGYISPGEQVLLDRDRPEEAQKASSSKKGTKTSKKGDGKKQVSLTSMMKAGPSKATSKKKDTVIRLTNSRGFEFGRLPQDVSSWVSPLLDMGIAEFRGKMIECPDRLTTGASMIMSVEVYLLQKAFKRSVVDLEAAKENEKRHLYFNEGAETMAEAAMRERKESILRLFDIVSLRPVAGVNHKNKKSEAQLHKEALQNLSQSKAKKRTEIVGDGEEIEVDDEENLSRNDLDMIYKRAQAHDRAMGDMEPAETFSLTLRPYQKQALLWMTSLENGKMDAREAASMHPLWSQYTFPRPATGDDLIDLTEDDKPFYFNPYSGELSMEFPKAERNCRGGILADEMGMGKTIMLSSLIQTNYRYDGPDAVTSRVKGKQLRLNSAFRPVNQRKSKPPSATLIVAPTALISQWANELERSSRPGTFKVVLWHGQNRLDLEPLVEDDKDTIEILDDDDDDALNDQVKPEKKKMSSKQPIVVVITSYGVLVSEHAKSVKSGSAVFDIEWLRVVLDEAHSCKSRTSRTAKAVYTLRARRRWAVTGTPIVNRLEDLYSLIKFLDFKPWSDFSFFRSFITLPFLARDPKAIEIVQVILESILLRREKHMRDSEGKQIVELPPKTINIEYLDFSTLEQKIYDSLYASIKKDFEQLNARGLVSKNYTHILAMLMKLRRAVLHPQLVHTTESAESQAGDEKGVVLEIDRMAQDSMSTDGPGPGTNTYATSILAGLQQGDGAEVVECPICMDAMDNPVLIPRCMHRCCKDCISTFLLTCLEKGEVPRCPTCSAGPIKESDLVEVVQNEAPPTGSQPIPGLILRKNDFQMSTKLKALVNHLSDIRSSQPDFRAIVFSQFTSFLDLIQTALKRERPALDVLRYDGTMDVKKRAATLEAFNAGTDKGPNGPEDPKVLLVSLKAGGVGLNLTVANHVFMMDCWWNAAVENQAIDRVHRLGQEKPVFVTHFIIANTIETRILQIQKRKTAIVKEAFRGSAGKGEANKESVENLRIMFGDD